jgi:predicted regulator of Ras-like GTPase activity (Roadblock/LC7/MglB family)
MSFESEVQSLLERCPGARGGAVIDPDGIPVVTEPRDRMLEELGAEYASVLRDVDHAGREFRHGGLRQLSIFAEDAVVVLTTISGGYFLVLVMDRDGLVGKARMLSRLTRERLFSEFL